MAARAAKRQRHHTEALDTSAAGAVSGAEYHIGPDHAENVRQVLLFLQRTATCGAVSTELAAHIQCAAELLVVHAAPALCGKPDTACNIVAAAFPQVPAHSLGVWACTLKAPEEGGVAAVALLHVLMVCTGPGFAELPCWHPGAVKMLLDVMRSGPTPHAQLAAVVLCRVLCADRDARQHRELCKEFHSLHGSAAVLRVLAQTCVGGAAVAAPPCALPHWHVSLASLRHSAAFQLLRVLWAVPSAAEFQRCDGLEVVPRVLATWPLDQDMAFTGMMLLAAVLQRATMRQRPQRGELPKAHVFAAVVCGLRRCKGALSCVWRFATERNVDRRRVSVRVTTVACALLNYSILADDDVFGPETARATAAEGATTCFAAPWTHMMPALVRQLHWIVTVRKAALASPAAAAAAVEVLDASLGAALSSQMLRLIAACAATSRECAAALLTKGCLPALAALARVFPAGAYVQYVVLRAAFTLLQQRPGSGAGDSSRGSRSATVTPRDHEAITPEVLATVFEVACRVLQHAADNATTPSCVMRVAVSMMRAVLGRCAAASSPEQASEASVHVWPRVVACDTWQLGQRCLRSVVTQWRKSQPSVNMNTLLRDSSNEDHWVQARGLTKLFLAIRKMAEQLHGRVAPSEGMTLLVPRGECSVCYECPVVDRDVAAHVANGCELIADDVDAMEEAHVRLIAGSLAVLVPCGHELCLSCLFSLRSAQCPFCRLRIEMVC